MKKPNLPSLNKVVEKAFGRAPGYYSSGCKGGPEYQSCRISGLPETAAGLWYCSTSGYERAGFKLRHRLESNLDRLLGTLQLFKDCRAFFVKQKYAVENYLSYDSNLCSTHIEYEISAKMDNSQKKLDNFVKTAREFLILNVGKEDKK